MSNLQILVAVPAYNCSSQIHRVIRQYVDSSFDSFVELLVIDNRSNDNTLEGCI